MRLGAIRGTANEFDAYIRFNHEEIMLSGHRKKESRRATLCELAIKHPASNQEQVYTGYAICNPGDHFERSKGRKYAFQHTVQQIDDPDARRQLWALFFNWDKAQKVKLKDM